jgi:hypothetical protein
MVVASKPDSANSSSATSRIAVTRRVERSCCGERRPGIDEREGILIF